MSAKTPCPPRVRAALLVLLGHVEPGWENCKAVVQLWLDGRLDNACCEETPCQWGSHPCERKQTRISDRCEKCPYPKDGCIFPRCGQFWEINDRVNELEATFDPEPQDWEQARHHNADKYIAMKHLALQLQRELDGALHAERVLYRQLTEARAVTHTLQKELEEAIFEAARALWSDSRFSESERLQKAFSNLRAQRAETWITA